MSTAGRTVAFSAATVAAAFGAAWDAPPFLRGFHDRFGPGEGGPAAAPAPTPVAVAESPCPKDSTKV